MKIECFNNNPMGTNTYVISSDNKNAAIIDPVGNIDNIIRYFDEKNLNLKHIILTHGHADHIGLVTKIKEITEALVYIHKDDEKMLNDKKLNLSTLFNDPMEFSGDIQLTDSQEIMVGDMILEIIHTPGHTPGSICIKVDQNLFTGDTVFKGSIGRTDFPGGDYSNIVESISKISKLNPNLIVFPGHGESSTLQDEIISNPYFN
ncbi:MBL fold metallo-hydrolase [Alkalibaculum sp. M08DMB]|uniref:MBL fold metallo-hydrolase n=1 Tax=Alkalibaculum sporogenes TaxID=2655001 RepID=A0A6A7K5M0_9FIRM|nr:MBL fold metallo-hydrolase [Alkalibaculum sporogenes]MPW24567.1 MBL fold metallo-hydrolase [Alkalibaculum sporogenes]